MTSSVRLTIGLIAALTAGAACADEAPRPAQACRQDAQTLCAGVAPGQGRILACLADHHDQLSTACRTALDALRSGQSPNGGSGH